MRILLALLNCHAKCILFLKRRYYNIEISIQSVVLKKRTIYILRTVILVLSWFTYKCLNNQLIKKEYFKYSFKQILKIIIGVLSYTQQKLFTVKNNS